ncbi:MAG: PAS domain S-box protein [Alphaproteobacteria bacterium]|nr:PAS domain S-box protein [Alphaproteobacteria bacterium]MCW5743279.1 PAS domain S-box protein [Alphaproteobacteria bacterium]
MIDERRRVEALRAYRILDTDREPVFDDVVERACELFGAPIALVAFIDAQRLWIKASRGISFTELARGTSICEHVLEQPGPLLVGDLSRDERFAGNPLVSGAPQLRFYAGAPIISAEGHYVGVVCVMDATTRETIEVAAVTGLGALARLCRNELEHRREMRILAASESRLRDLAMVSTDWFWETDAEHRFVDVERDGTHRYPSPDSVVGKTRWELANADLAHPYWQAHLAILARRAEFRHFEYRLPHADGTLHWIRVSGQPVFEDGVFRGYRGGGTDITAQRDIEERLRDLASLSTDWTWETDSEHRFVRLDMLMPTAPFDFNYISGVTRWQIAGADTSTEPWRSHIAQLNAREEFRDFEYEMARPDGARMTVRISGRPIFEGGVFRGYRGAARDITAQRRAEEKLSERETAFATLFRRHPQPMWIHEPGTLRFLDVNDAMCTTYGYTREELARLTAQELRVPEQRASLAELVASIPRDAGYQAERQHITKDGRRIDVIVNVAPTEFDGRPARFVMVRDVTQQRAAETRAAEAERTLRQNQQIEALAKLAGGMAHEFNNLLTVIISANEMLSDGLPEGGEERQLAGMALEAAQRGAQLADSLMTISRRQDLSVLRIDVGAVVRRMDEPLRRLLGGAIALESDIATAPLLCELDEGQLEAAIGNLASNARDAMREGGIVRLRALPREVTQAEALADARLQPGSWVVVSMQDSGLGMAPAVAAKAFEPYFTTKPVGQGMGLGLSMVHGFVHQSGGFATIDSRVGSGTTVSLFFPAVRTRRDFAST